MNKNNLLKKCLEKRILILDGAMGTMLQNQNLSEKDFRGKKFKNHPIDLKGNNELLSITKPESIEAVHRAYLEAGADIIECNTFSANSISQKDYQLEDSVKEMNYASVRLAKKLALEYSTYDILVSDVDMAQTVEKTMIKNLLVCPSNINLAGAEVELVSMMSREQRLKEKLDEVKDKFDYILIDCPPSLGLITLNAFTASDSVLIPVQCEYYALEGLGQLLNTINLVKKHLNKTLEIEGALLTMYDARTNLSNQVVKEVKKYFGDKVYKTVIPRNVRLSEAPSYGMPITEYDPKSKGAKTYEKFTKEFLKINNG